ncbi:MAG: hypothetical protein WB505_08350, partial [Pseudolabrys sp.]
RQANATLHHHYIDSGLWRVVTVGPGIHCRSIQLQRNTQCQFEIANFLTGIKQLLANSKPSRDHW